MDTLISIDEAIRQRSCKSPKAHPNSHNWIYIQTDPVTAPRQSQSSRWKPTPHIQRYRCYRDELRIRCNAAKFTLSDQIEMIFYLPMPKSWSKRRKLQMDNQPAKSNSKDIDNLAKAVMDALLPQDRHVWRIVASKFWAYSGGVHIKNFE